MKNFKLQISLFTRSKLNINIKVYWRQVLIFASSAFTVVGFVFNGVAHAQYSSGAGYSNSTNTTSNTTNTVNQQHLQTMIARGNEEIDRRLTSLNKLSGVISSATKLTSADRASLTSEVNAEITGLTALKTTLDAETTVSTASTDVQSIFTEYRVYALVVPKVYIVKTADDQQVVESLLNTLSQKLQTRITTAQNQGKNVTTLQSELSDLNSKVSAAQAISSSLEQSVIALQPSDYNTDHSILSGDTTQLKTAHTDNQAAYQDAKNIVSGLKSL